MGIQGFLPDPNELYDPWDPFGCTSWSPNLLIQLLYVDVQFSLKIAGGPCGLPIVPCGSLSCLFPLGGNLRVTKKAPLLAHRARDLQAAL